MGKDLLTPSKTTFCFFLHFSVRHQDINQASRLFMYFTLSSLSIFFVSFTDEKPFEFTTLLHTYFRVPDVTKTTVSGLTGLTYVDKVHIHCFIFTRYPKRLAYSL